MTGSLTLTMILVLMPMLTIDALAIFAVLPLLGTFRASMGACFVHSLMSKRVADTILNYLGQFETKSVRLSALGGVMLIM